MISKETEYSLQEHLDWHWAQLAKEFEGHRLNLMPPKTPHADFEVTSPLGQSFKIECKWDEAGRDIDIGPEMLCNLPAIPTFPDSWIYNPKEAEHDFLWKLAAQARLSRGKYAGIAAADFKAERRLLSYARMSFAIRRYYLLEQNKLSALLFEGESPAVSTLPLYTSRLNGRGRNLWYSVGVKIPLSYLEEGGQFAAAVIASREVSVDEWKSEHTKAYQAKLIAEAAADLEELGPEWTNGR